MPKFSTHFPFIKLKGSRNPSNSQANAPALGNTVTRGVVMPQVSNLLPINAVQSAETEQAVIPANVAQGAGDPCMIVTDVGQEAVVSVQPAGEEERSSEARPVTVIEPEATPQIIVGVTEIREEEQKQVSAELYGPPVLGHEAGKDVPKTQISETNGWKLLKDSLKVVKELSSAFIPLKSTISAMIVVMDYVDMVQENDTKLCDLATEVGGLVKIFMKYQDGSIPRSMYDRLHMITEKLVMIQKAIEEKKKYALRKRVITASKDKADLVDMCEDITKLLKFFLMQTSLEAYLGIDFLLNEEKMKSLGHVFSATINAIREDECLKGTRKQILRDLEEWCHDSNAPPVYWLVGPAGAGKSTIARTFCRNLQDQLLLGGSFFCHRLTAERSDAKHIIPTLAWGLACCDFGYHQALMRVTDIASVANSIVAQQIDKLLKEPCKFLTHNHLVFVVDALDECHDQDIVGDILQHLLKSALGMGIKFFITSRPDPHIQKELNDRWHPGMHQTFYLQDVQKDIVTQDISNYIHHQLRDVQASNQDIPPEWPSQSDVDILTERAEGLFVFASTALLFIGRNNPRARMEVLIKTPGKAGKAFIGGLHDIYTFILTKAMNPEVFIEAEILITKNILEILIAARAPLTISMVAKFLGQNTNTIRSSLNYLHAVVQVPPYGHDDDIVSTYHASFPDFLIKLQVDAHSSNPACDVLQELFKTCYLPIQLSSGHHLLATSCMAIMESELKFNITQCLSSFFPNSKQQLQPIERPLLYSCLNWPYHIIQAMDSSIFLDLIEGFLKSKFLFWLEVLSATENTRLASGMLMRIYNSNINIPESLQTMVGDANEFVMDFQEVISLSIPHIYLSAVPNMHESSTLARSLQSKVINGRCLQVEGVHRQRGMRPTLQGHDDNVNCVAIRHDGTQIASCSNDHTIRIWNTISGEEVMSPLREHTGWVQSVAFSPDGKQIVSGSDDKTIQVWDAELGHQVMPPLEGHTGYVQSVAFSPDGKHIVSGSHDKTIRVWDAVLGMQMMAPFEGHRDWVQSVTFSPDGKQIVSGSDDKTIRVWDAQSGQQVMPPIAGHTDWVRSVAFSPNGKHIVSGSDDNTIRVWDNQSGEQVMPPLVGHTDWVRSVAFSPDGKQIVSGSDDKTIRVWDAESGQQVMQLEGHTDCIQSVTFSSDGKLIVSGSSDQTIRVWDATALISPFNTKSLDSYPVATQSMFPVPIRQRPDYLGWLRGCDNQLLMWFPPAYHPFIAFPPCINFISGQARVIVDTTHFPCGTKWPQCWIRG